MEELLKKLKIKTKNKHLYKQALTHTSYANETSSLSYERLEFLGDAVLELIISEYLYLNTDDNEGTMTKVRSHYVCENALYEYSKILNLNEYVRLGKGESESGGKYRKTILADIFEAFIGAMFLDKGLNYVKKFIYKYIVPLIKDNNIDFLGDYKSTLQELVQTDKRNLEYVVTNEEGPSHNKLFTVIVKIDDIVYGKGTAHSKKEAEQLAARDALKKSVKE
ncbi:MAG: ribonuclease III [Mollicutes bacterium]|nr:ribonuclease III [Mollicutes bacterium]